MPSGEYFMLQSSIQPVLQRSIDQLRYFVILLASPRNMLTERTGQGTGTTPIHNKQKKKAKKEEDDDELAAKQKRQAGAYQCKRSPRFELI